MPEVILKSPRTDSVLTFGRSNDEGFWIEYQSFGVSVRSHAWFEEEMDVVSFVDFFRDLATCWRGWEGEKTWQPCYGVLEKKLTCRADKVGHIEMWIDMDEVNKPLKTWWLRCCIIVEAGQLSSLATQIERLLLQ